MTETPSITVYGANSAPIAGAANSSWANTKSPTIGKTTGQRSPYDLIPWHRPPGHVIIGGGLAGLTAARYTAREGIDTLVIERAALGRRGS